MSNRRGFPEEARDWVDLRSDTVTRPTAEMYEAMLNAPLGDDVLGDEPTVMELEAIAASKVGKEAAMFVPSGTMGNQIALATHCRPGDAAIFEEQAHMLFYESGAPAVIAQVLTWTLASNHGVMDPAEVERRITIRNLHTPGTTLLCLENTHNRASGAVIPLETLASYRTIADQARIPIHMDGARVFNAATACKVGVQEITKHVDTVNFCLSKGLGSPVGSVLCGPSDFIQQARQWRKRLGGSMRQAGILAACGIVSLTKMVARLQDDHDNAQRLVGALLDVEGLTVYPERVQSNIVMVDVKDSAPAWQEALKEHGIRAMAIAPHRIRLVFHYDVDQAGTERAIEAFKAVASRRKSA